VDATQVVETTLEAIRNTLTAAGVSEGSAEFERQAVAQRCAVAPPATPTALPVRVRPAGEAVTSADCLGSDLPGTYDALWLDGAWVEAQHFELADDADRRAAQAAYERYLDFLAFRAGPPPADFARALQGYMLTDGTLPSPQSCLAADVIVAASRLQRQGVYVRLSLPEGLAWEPDYRFSPGPAQLQIVLRWRARSVRQELVDAANGNVLKQAAAPLLAGTAWLQFDAGVGGWRVLDDGNGYYCNQLSMFAP
jgi:hypothetical protein